MSSSNGILALVLDEALRHDVDRIAAAAGVRVVHADEPSNRKVWAGASAVVVDVGGAERCAELDLPRRPAVLVVARLEPGAAEWRLAMAIGAQRVLVLPSQESELVAELSDAVSASREGNGRGAVVAVIGGRGGAGASIFATALALAAPRALLIDVDPWSGGIDLALGSEGDAGLRWPELALGGGRVAYPALCSALPSRRGVAVLSTDRAGGEIGAAALDAVVDAGCRGGATVVCDLPRRATHAVESSLDAADLVVLVTTADVRSCAAAGAMARWLLTTNQNLGLVVRGPAPGGLRSKDVARITNVPLLAAMRPLPGLATELEHGGLRRCRRSPLVAAARRVLAVLPHQPGDAAAPSAA